MTTFEDLHVYSGAVEQAAGRTFAGEPRWFRIAQVVLILGFGGLQSVLLFGYKTVPNPDFTAIVQTGHEVLSLEVPSSFKRAPVVGILQACLSHVVGGPHADLRAGWLLNGLLHPFSLLLFWLLARRIVGTAAVWLTLIIAINPFLLWMFVEPLIEIPLLFFCLLTSYLILTGSRWRYFFASVTAMVRYEAAVLIVAAFVIDVIANHDRKARIRTFGYSVLAVLPLVLWLLGTLVTWKGNSGHYLAMMFSEEPGGSAEKIPGARHGIRTHLELLWKVSVRSLVCLRGGFLESQAKAVWLMSKVVAGCGLVWGCIYGLRYRRTGVLILLMFFVPYFLVHVLWPFPIERFHVNIFWIAVLLCCLGLKGIRADVVERYGAHPRLDTVLLIVLLVASIVGFLSILRVGLTVVKGNWKFLALWLAATGVVGLVFAARVFIFGRKTLLREMTVLACTCFMILSSQVVTGQVLGDGLAEKEFKLLAQWYMENAKPGEKMLTTLPSVVTLFMPDHRDCILHTDSMEADSPEDFVQKCRKNDITYVVWDSRLGFAPEDYYYRLWHLENMAELENPTGHADYACVARIILNEQQFVNIFRVRASNEEAVTEGQQ